MDNLINNEYYQDLVLKDYQHFEEIEVDSFDQLERSIRPYYLLYLVLIDDQRFEEFLPPTIDEMTDVEQAIIYEAQMVDVYNHHITEENKNKKAIPFAEMALEKNDKLFFARRTIANAEFAKNNYGLFFSKIQDIGKDFPYSNRIIREITEYAILLKHEKVASKYIKLIKPYSLRIYFEFIKFFYNSYFNKLLLLAFFWILWMSPLLSIVGYSGMLIFCLIGWQKTRKKTIYSRLYRVLSYSFIALVIVRLVDYLSSVL